MHHGAGLRALLVQSGRTDADADAFVAGLTRHDPVGLTPTERAMLDYTVKLTVTPRDMTAADVAALRAHGLSDRAIHDLCAIVAYFAFVNRIADGLGVELEERFGS